MSVEAGRSDAAARNRSMSLRRALQVLEYVQRHAGRGHGIPLTTIAGELGMSKSTVLRLAVPLVEAELLVRDVDTGWFRLGHGALRLGQAYLTSLDLRAVAAETLHRLLRIAGETVHLVVYDPPDIVYIDKVENEANVRMASRVGSRAPAHCTAVGKAILAFSGDEAVHDVIDAGLPRRTDNTITDPGRLRRELGNIRARGYSVDDRENEPEVRCIAAAIFDHADRVAGALSISGLAFRITPARVRELGPVITDAALTISRQLGAQRSQLPIQPAHKSTEART